MRRGTGLGAKLLLAFLVITGLPAAAALVGWLELGGTARIQEAASRDTIPALAEVRGFAEASARIVAVAPELAAVQTEDERRERTSWLFAQGELLNRRLAPYRNSDPEAIAGLEAAVGDLRGAIGVLDLVVQRRILARESQRRRLGEAMEAAAELGGIADTLVANAEAAASAVLSSLYEIGPDREASRLAALDKLIEVDLFQLSLMFELRAQASELGLLLNRLATLPDRPSGAGAELAALRAGMERRLSVVARRIQTIPDPVRADRAMTLLTTIRAGAARTPGARAPGAPDLLDATQTILGLEDRIAAARAGVIAAASRIDAGAGVLATSVQERALDAGAGVLSAMRLTRSLQAWGAATALLVSLAVLWFYVRGNVTRRLDRLSASMARLAEGRIEDGIEPRGRDEIAAMERAVEIFRRQALHNRDLEAERTRHLEELHRHRNELRELVDERTEALREEVARHAVARGKAEAADRAKSEFLAMMSHEIRTPMNGMQGMIRSLPRDGLSPRQREQVSALEQSGDRLMVILGDILDFIRAEHGAEPPRAEPFSLSALLEDVRWLLAPAAAEKGLGFRVSRPDDLPDHVVGDRGRLRQILVNLLSNAIRYTDRGGTALDLSWRPEGEGVALAFRVSDTGRGISPEAQERVFEPFEQENGRAHRQFGGTGLGLAICRRFAAEMGGGLSLESAPGEGSVFTFRLRLPRADAPPPVPAPALPGLPPLSLLVVEDHPVNRMVIEAMLEPLGHRAEIVESGEAAVAAAAARRFDAVLMDVDLPGISGVEATRRIRALPDPARAAVPVIGVSAHVGGAEAGASLAAGMSLMLAKPLSPERLGAALAAVIGGAAPPPAGAALGSALRDLPAETVADLARLFLDRLDAACAALAAAAERGEPGALSREAHRLAGAAANFDLAPLVDCLQEIDRQARAGDAAPAALARLAPLAADARAAIRSELAALPDQSSAAVKT